MEARRPADDETLDPAESRRARLEAGPLRAVVEIAYHADLRRVGERFILGSVGDAAAARGCSIGRDAPRFGLQPGGGRALADPCLSRRQLSVRWSDALSRFSVEVPRDARRAVTAYDARGHGLGVAPLDLAPGCFVALGDRALLLLTLRPALGSAGAQPLHLLGDGAAMVALREELRSVATLDETVLLRGEVGTGKELAAREIHARSARHAGPFVALNCAALPESLAESELFGHVRGAFSGAVTARDGLFGAARGGTLLLDEVGELPLPLQAKLLRALQERAVRRVGADAEAAVDARVIAATHRDLVGAAAAGTFRADLYSRLEGLTVVLPPLRDRREDIPFLFTTFLHAQLERPEAAGARWLVQEASAQPPPLPLEFVLGLLGREFPRNVRELEKLALAVVARNLGRDTFRAPPADAAATSGPTSPDGGWVSPRAGGAARGPGARGRPDIATLVALLERHQHVQGRVARELGVSHSTIDRWMRELRLSRPRDLGAERIRAALAEAGGDGEAAARALGISARGLTLRLRDLGD